MPSARPPRKPPAPKGKPTPLPRTASRTASSRDSTPLSPAKSLQSPTAPETATTTTSSGRRGRPSMRKGRSASRDMARQGTADHMDVDEELPSASASTPAPANGRARASPEEGGQEEEDKGEGSSTGVIWRYPGAQTSIDKMPVRFQQFKTARYIPCLEEGCECEGMIPPPGTVVAYSREEEELEEETEDRTKEGWWRACGRCGHGWEVEGVGHRWENKKVDSKERTRRARAVGRIEELLQVRSVFYSPMDSGQLTMFPTPPRDDLDSLFKQLDYFHRPQGGKRTETVPPLPPPIDLTSPSTVQSPALNAPTENGDESEERPRKKSRLNGEANGSAKDKEKDDKPTTGAGGRQGKKPGKGGGAGKGAGGGGKGTKPRTVVRGTRGLVPMETDADGTQHEGGKLPESAAREGDADGGGEDEDEDEEEVPLAVQRPQLDEQERQRRVMLKEKEREREDAVTRRVTKAEEAALESGVRLDADFWEGVELPKLPLRPAAVEQVNREIILPVVTSRNPTPVASILLIGLKNLFQKQLPKMPREYITRLVLDKNHISMAIVKRGWKVVGGICYRPFESRGFAEIVFCAVDSSEQIKGYGSHLMNSLKDHVRKAHPTINHFLTYADNYAVGYFKKQGFTKEITYPRERWVGYIKDYEGGTIMQCTMLPKVRYLEIHQMLADQKAAILAKIKTLTKSHIVHPGLKIFKEKKPGEVTLSKQDVPGLAESGWNPELDAIMRQPRRNPYHGILQLVLDDLEGEQSAWPFVKPVDGNVVHDYYEVIQHPMDLQTMGTKLENNHYEGIDDFLEDARLMFANCRQYNGEKNTYAVQANKLEKALDVIMKKRMTVV